MSIITLLTDYGTSDSYVAEVKGVLLSRAADLTLVDVTHDIAPGDIRAAQYVLQRAWPQFPRGTVHLAVVDPTVGTARRALAAQVTGHHFVAPDNGLLTFLPADARFAALAMPAHAAATFHGRDVFAPAAAALAVGVPLSSLGEPIHDPHRLPLPVPQREGRAIVGEVIYVDRFGSLISNIPGPEVQPGSVVRVSGTDAGPLLRTFADVAPGALVAYVGSGGTVEIAVRDGNAAESLKRGAGAEVRIEDGGGRRKAAKVGEGI